MRWRGVEIAGALAVAGVLVLIALTFWPQSESPEAVVTQSSGESILDPADPSPSPTPAATAQPGDTDDAPDDETVDSQPADIPVDRRPEIAVQVLNAGAEDGAAQLATGALTEQSFAPRAAADAVSDSPSTVVLHADNRRRAALTVARIVGADPDQVTRATGDDPNWAAFGTDLDVLVIIGPPLP